MSTAYMCKVCNINRPIIFMHTNKCLDCMLITTLNPTQLDLVNIYNSCAGSEKCEIACDKCNEKTIRSNNSPYVKYYPQIINKAGITKHICCECILILANDEKIFQ